jgi:hypothetical protein
MTTIIADLLNTFAEDYWRRTKDECLSRQAALELAREHFAPALRALEHRLVRPCDACGNPTCERGNGSANLCHLCDPERKLGARVLEILRSEVQQPSGIASTTAQICALQDIAEAARDLGLLAVEPRP